MSPIHDPRIPAAQRQAMVRNMGKAYGNRVVQRAVGHEPMLRTGSSGAAVTTLQEHLVKAGAAIAVDGIFGPQTYRAVTAYQRAAGLSVDGIVGPNTWASLKAGGVTIKDFPAGGDGGGGSQSAEVVTKLKKVKTILNRLNTEHPDVPATQTAEPPTPEPREVHSHDADEEQETGGWLSDWFGGDSESEQKQQEKQDQGGGWGSWWDSITDWFSQTWQRIKEAILGISSQVKRELDRASNRVKSLFGRSLEMLRDLIRSGFGEDAARKLDEIIDRLSGKPEGAEERPVSGELADFAGGSLETNCGDSARPRKGVKPRRMQLNVTTIPSVRQGDVGDSDWGHDRVDGSAIWVRANIMHGGKVKSGWGHTTAKWNVRSIRWTLEEDLVRINATIVVDTFWNIDNNTCKDVTGPYGEHVKPETWKQIVDELTPAAYGAPTRKEYWSSHITTIHELFHANEYYTKTKSVLPEKIAEMNKETIEVPWGWITDDDKRDIDTRVMMTLFGLCGKLDEEVYYYVKMQGGEARAYRDGGPLYQRLVNQIKQRAEHQVWPGTEAEKKEKEEQEKKKKKP